MPRSVEIEQIRRLIQPVEDGGRAQLWLAKGLKRILPLVEGVAIARWGGAEIDTPKFDFAADGQASLSVAFHPITDSRQQVVISHTLGNGGRRLTVSGREQTFSGGLPGNSRERRQLREVLNSAFDNPKWVEEQMVISPED
ncbi:hypothetical protein HYT17_01785 [Candidatus Microgenomates bacterium]|nr:hypothetical protein [Candidatus Microgenomates bacterium]